MSLAEQVEQFHDVHEELIHVPQWGDVAVLFRGLTFDALEQLQGVDIGAAQTGDILQAVKIIQATAVDPETNELAFPGEAGEKLLKRKSFESLLYCMEHGALVVLGIDKGETAGKDFSSTETGTPANV